jgi:hypothetical protein
VSYSEETKVPTTSQVIARQLESAANAVSGLALEDIGEDGHAIANRLWKIAAHLKNQSRRNVSPDVIRAWARLHGHRIYDTGRVPAAIVAEYYEQALSPIDDDSD